MKAIIFGSIILTSILSAANDSKLEKRLVDINNPNIICSHVQEDLQININTAKGKVWFRNLSSYSQRGLEVTGPVFSGVNSSEKFTGEILGDIELKEGPFFFTLILRNVNGKAQLETQLYPKDSQNDVRKLVTKSCDLK